MPTIEIRNVPTAVHAVLRRRAAAAGQSLPNYVLARLEADAAHPTVDEVLERAGSRTGGARTLAEATRIVRAHRDSAPRL
jgi:hypothetical protein